MSYLGNQPAANFASVTKDTFSGDGSTTAFTLSKAATTNGVAVFVENVRQEPTTAYSVSGTTLTFTAAPVSASGNNIYVLHHNTPASTATHPSAQALTATSGTFSSAVTINTTDTNFDVGADDLIVGSGSGDSGITIYTGGSVGDKGSIFFADSTVGSSAEKKGQISYEQNNEIMTFLTNDTLAMQIDLNGHVTKPLQPAFYAYHSSAPNNLAKDAYVDFTFDTERFDNNSDFNPSNGTFTAPVTGKYLFNMSIRLQNAVGDHTYIYFQFNSSNSNHPIILASPGFHGDAELYVPFTGSALLDMDANDTCKIRYYQEGGTASIDVGYQYFDGHLVC